MGSVFHMYHMVSVSPWPLLVGGNVLIIMVGLVKGFMSSIFDLFFMGMILVGITVFLWWRDVIREGTMSGDHSSMVQVGLMYGMVLFIVSEVFFFISFFWAFFHSSLSPVVELGSVWPPEGVMSFNPFQVPLLNTIILLTSGVSVTWCHQSVLNGFWEGANSSLLVTWLLGFYFLMLQMFEYFMSSFSIGDSVFGAVFFMATGFHGFHVVVGTLFLFIMWGRIVSGHFSTSHHFGFEAGAWYWHFVDVVWLFLFSVVYWWGT